MQGKEKAPASYRSPLNCRRYAKVLNHQDRGIIACFMWSGTFALAVERVLQSYIIFFDMRTNEIFSRVLDAVSVASDLNKETVLSNSRASEVVDARYICIMLLHKRGFTHRQIGERLGMTKQGVSYALNHCEERAAAGGPTFTCIYDWACRILKRGL